MDTNASSLRLFRRNKLFAGVADATIAECAKQFTLVHARRRKHLYRQGDPCNQIYCLLRGSFRISRVAQDGSEFTTRLAGHSDLFGEEAFFEDASFSSTATALCDGIVAVCSAARMRSLLVHYPALLINLAQYFRAQQNRTLERLERVANMPVRERIIALFRDLAAQCDDHDALGGKYEIKLTHMEIASLVGSTRETVSSVLGKLVRAGLVSKNGRRILIDLALTDEAA